MGKKKSSGSQARENGGEALAEEAGRLAPYFVDGEEAAWDELPDEGESDAEDAGDAEAVAPGAKRARLPRGRNRGQRSLARRIFVALACVSAVAAVAVLALSTVIYQNSALDETSHMLETQCGILSSTLRGDDTDLMRLANIDMDDVRITLISSDGTVLYDNENAVESMPNHASRPEVAEALASGAGSAERESDTAGCVEIYRAIRTKSGSVLRLAVTRESAAGALSHDVFLAAAVVLVVILVCWAVSRLVVDFIVSPILAIDPANPSPSSSYAEVEPLVERIDEQIDELRGNDLMRREFTSNVTHELKTPLSTISGAAELIRDGIVKPEDVGEFAGRIYDEAQHMTSLVNDILTLSKLDESERSRDVSLLGTPEPVDLRHVLADVQRRLTPSANNAEVTIGVEGESVIVLGLPRLLDELAYNLCDNAIRYNRPGGTVSASVAVVEGRPTLVVADTGLGIPAEAQAKVFERFYRVEGSRSRERGGTGLGLAIVKHAAACHGAELSLTSEPGQGTTITVTFPASSLVSLS